MYEEFRKRMDRRGSFMGETMRRQSDMIVNATWLNSVSARRVQVKWLNRGLPPEYASAEEFEDPIDAHFELKSEYSVANGASPYYLTFRPGELIRHPEIKVGAYVSIPNVDNIPEWWIIVFIEDDNELKKSYIMKCNWTFNWVVDGKIYSHLGVLRNGSSTREADENAYTTTVNGNGVMWMATNFDTQTLKHGQRLLISDEGRMPPLCYSIGDIIDTRPIGLTKFVLTQNTYDASHDNAELMLANYYDSNVEPEESDPEIENLGTAVITYNGTKPTVKVGGSYKIFTASFSDENVTVDKWLVSDENGDISADTNNYTIEYLDKQMKLKVAQNYELIGKVLIVQVIGSDNSTAEIRVEVI
jgi:hypothetical protein